MIEEVVAFNRDLLGIPQREPHMLNSAEWKWLRAALLEELNETDQAFSEEHLVKMVDGILDLLYFGIGGLYRMGLTEEQINLCFQAVHTANLKKKAGVKETRPNDGTVADAIKPEGFVPPEEAIHHILFGDVIEAYGDR